MVRHSMYFDTANKAWELKTPKNGKSRIVDFGDTLARILMRAKSEQEENRLTYGELYQRHFCGQENICGRQHYLIYSDVPTPNGVISSRVGHGHLLTKDDTRKNLMKLDFVCRKEDGELLTPQTLKN